MTRPVGVTRAHTEPVEHSRVRQLAHDGPLREQPSRQTPRGHPCKQSPLQLLRRSVAGQDSPVRSLRGLRVPGSPHRRPSEGGCVPVWPLRRGPSWSDGDERNAHHVNPGWRRSSATTVTVRKADFTRCCRTASRRGHFRNLRQRSKSDGSSWQDGGQRDRAAFMTSAFRETSKVSR